MDALISVGDIVELNSGGPKMTVTRKCLKSYVAPDIDENKIFYCSWFSNGTFGQSEFPFNAIKLSEKGNYFK